MAKDKKSFILYTDLIHTVNKLPDEKAGELFKHILSYVNDENPTTEDILLQVTFEPIRQQLKRDLQRYLNICDRNKLNGQKGGRPKKPKKPSGLSGNPEKPKKPDNDNDNDNDINKGPAFKEFKIYAQEKCKEYNYIYSETDLKMKFDAWNNNNWINGNGKKIKNWKSTLINSMKYIFKPSIESVDLSEVGTGTPKKV